MEPSELAEVLRGPTVTPQQARQAASEGGAPDDGGLYAWWAAPGAIPQLEGPGHPSERLELFYVGIAPARLSSGTSIRRRVVGQHLGGNTGSSTFRLTLASLLWQEQGWTPCWKTDRALLTKEDNKKLSEWQWANLRVRWAEQPQPYDYEGAVIALMEPPLNLAGNPDHPFHATLTAARKAFRAAAQDNPC